MNPQTPKFRVSYPKVFKAEMNKLSKKEEYSIVALFPKGADMTKLKAAAQKAIETKWGTDQSKWPKNLKTPFRDQAEKAKDVNGKQVLPDGHEAGAIFMNLKSAQKPGVVNSNLDPIIEATEFYSGCYAIASVRPYAYDQAGNRGVAFGLVNLQKVGDGEPLGSRSRPEDDFAPIEAGETTKDTNNIFN